MKKPNNLLLKIRTVIAYFIIFLCIYTLIVFLIYKEAYSSLIVFICSIFACIIFDSYAEEIFKLKENQEEKEDKK